MFLDTFRHIWMEFYSILFYNLDFPDPIGSIKPITILMFFGVAYVIADFVNLIASRRD